MFVHLAPWSSGQDATLSRSNQGFDSPGGQSYKIHMGIHFIGWYEQEEYWERYDWGFAICKTSFLHN